MKRLLAYWQGINTLGVMNAMSNAVPAPSTRHARADYVRSALKDKRWSVRAASMAIGMSHTALGDRVKGLTPFLADEIESIANVLDVDPVEFFSGYLSAGNPPSPFEGAEERTTDYGSADSNVVDLTERILPAADREDGKLGTVTPMWA